MSQNNNSNNINNKKYNKKKNSNNNYNSKNKEKDNRKFNNSTNKLEKDNKRNDNDNKKFKNNNNENIVEKNKDDYNLKNNINNDKVKDKINNNSDEDKLGKNNKIIVGLIVGLIALLIIIIFAILTTLPARIANKNRSDIKEFDSNSIINNIKIDGIVISSFNTLGDIKEKLNANIAYIDACTVDDKCKSYNEKNFDIDKLENENFYKINFGFSLEDEDGEAMYVDFGTLYRTYKKQLDNVHYTNLAFIDPTDIVTFDGIPYRQVTRSTIESRYKISDESNDRVYYVDFKSKDDDKFYFTGNSKTKTFEIVNTTEFELNK